jgi:hypothetical protein
MLRKIISGGQTGADRAGLDFAMDEVQGRVQATYGENYERLASVKAKYDPEKPPSGQPEHHAEPPLDPGCPVAYELRRERDIVDSYP